MIVKPIRREGKLLQRRPTAKASSGLTSIDALELPFAPFFSVGKEIPVMHVCNRNAAPKPVEVSKNVRAVGRSSSQIHKSWS